MTTRREFMTQAAVLGAATFGVRELHAPRVVQSLYLDTPAGRALQENLAGLSERRKLRLGLVTLCVGGGMGIATIVERL